jgi:hypothetical protein
LQKTKGASDFALPLGEELEERSEGTEKYKEKYSEKNCLKKRGSFFI